MTKFLSHAPRQGPAPVTPTEKGAVFLLGAAAVALALFVTVAAGVSGEPGSIDVRILMALRNPADLADPLGPGRFEEAMRDLTALGGVAVLTLATLTAFTFLMLTGKRHAAWLVLGAVLGGVIVSQGLKVAFARPRPELAPYGAPVFTQSFPSGHAMMSAIVYLTIAALLARTQAMARVKAFMFVIAAAVAILVGVSRVYLGVHWPTDVLAGWAAGCAWALGCWTLTYRLQRGGQVEPEDEVIAEDGDGILTSRTAAARADSSPER
jgi:undecaprenyl-diphosphatase